MKSRSSTKRTQQATPARHRLHVALFVALATLSGGNAAFAQQGGVAAAPQDYSITAGNLGDALNQLATQSGLQIIYSPDLVSGKTVPAISGRRTWRDALRTLLANSGLEWNLVNDSTVVIRRSDKPKPSGKAPATPAPETAQAPEPAELQAVTVTGTRIRGGTTPSPVITIGAEAIQEEGFNDLGEVIRDLPQNFSGGQNPGVVVGATLGSGGIANQNSAGASALNLRGLGPDATLTLLNGRRLSYGGFAQAVDISAIPIEAIDRVEIVPDGASAIYGSDAVGGVGNVILKRDYDGVTIGARYGGATDGGLATREYTATAGTTWSTGGLIATYKSVSTDPIYARQRDYADYMYDPTTLYPGDDLHSGLVSLHQSIGSSVEFRLDAFTTHRREVTYPHNTGLAPYYYRIAAKDKTFLVSPGVEIYLPGDWTLSMDGSWGGDDGTQDQSMVSIADGLGTTVFHSCSCNDIRSYEIGAEGPLFAMPGGDARLAVGAGVRKNEFASTNYLSGTNYADGHEGSRFAYAEINLPLVGPDSGVAGVRRLDVTAAVRGEDYDSFGRVTTPKFGVVYGPGNDFTLKASWGKSFKAPTLFQLYQTQTAALDPASFYGGAEYGPDATVLALGGGNPDLGAERATTWTVSSAFHPEALPGLEAELTWFDIDYTDRVVQPITDYSRAIVNPKYAQFIDHFPGTQAIDDVLGSVDAFYNFTGMPFDPDNIVAIMNGQYVNVARQRIRGLDLSSSYRLDIGSGRLTIRGSATWLRSSQQNGAGQETYDIAGTIFNPAKAKGRVGAVWSQGGFSASAFANYVAGVLDGVNNRKTASFTTFDATVRYATGEDDGALSGLDFALSARNLFNRSPPFYAAATLDAPPYDSTNYSAIGRFLSLSVSKHW